MRQLVAVALGVTAAMLWQMFIHLIGMILGHPGLASSIQFIMAASMSTLIIMEVLDDNTNEE